MSLDPIIPGEFLCVDDRKDKIIFVVTGGRLQILSAKCAEQKANGAAYSKKEGFAYQ